MKESTPVSEVANPTSTLVMVEDHTPTPTLTIISLPHPTVTPAMVKDSVTPTPRATDTSVPATPVADHQAVIINHTSLELFDKIPDSFISKASQIRFMMRHASVGTNIDLGLSCVWGNFPGRQPSSCSDFFNPKYDRSKWSFQFRSNPGWIEKVNDFVDQVNLQSNDFDAFSLKFGYVDGLDDAGYPPISDPVNFQTYFIDKFEALEAQYPDKVFILWTMPLARLGYENTEKFNTMVREYAIARGKFLMDIADIETYDPSGVKHTNEQGYAVIYKGYTKEKKAGHLDEMARERVAKAFWILMARLAGWDGQAQ